MFVLFLPLKVPVKKKLANGKWTVIIVYQ